MSSPAFKEWSLICQALADGSQSLILRKGGIAEGRAGFEWKHEEFYLFPTHFHEQVNQVRGATKLPAADPNQHSISLWARLEWHATVTDWTTVARLAPFHHWTEEVVRERFAYLKEGSLSVAALRVFRLEAPFSFPDAPSYGGCRSWVQIPAPEALPEMVPVLDDACHASRMAQLGVILPGTPLTIATS